MAFAPKWKRYQADVSELSTDQLELLAWLRRNAPSLAELYEGAVVMLQNRPPAHVRLIAHSVREVRNRLPGWSCTRRAIATLLDAGFEAKDAAIPVALKKSAWTLLSELAEDDNPSSRFEAEYGGSNMDPATLSLNTTRGQAVHGVVRYALWLQRSSADPDKFSFADAPEVKAVLDSHLDVSRDPSLAIRSVYGQWFPWLVLLDRDWAVANAGKIFPSEDAAIDYWHAARSTYVKFNPPYNNIAAVLSTQYAAAVLKLDAVRQERKEGGEAAREVAQHVVVLYGRGQLEKSSLLQDFFAHAELCRHRGEFAQSARGIGHQRIEEYFQGSAGTLPSAVGTGTARGIPGV